MSETLRVVVIGFDQSLADSLTSVFQTCYPDTPIDIILRRTNRATRSAIQSSSPLTRDTSFKLLSLSFETARQHLLAKSADYVLTQASCPITLQDTPAQMDLLFLYHKSERRRHADLRIPGGIPNVAIPGIVTNLIQKLKEAPTP